LRIDNIHLHICRAVILQELYETTTKGGLFDVLAWHGFQDLDLR